MFFLGNNCFFLVFFLSVMFIGLYVTSNVVKLMFIAYFSLSLAMMGFSACVNDSVRLLYMLLFKSCLWLLVMGFGSSCDITTCIWWLSVYFKGTKQISVLQ